jgi:hypothetical protein
MQNEWLKGEPNKKKTKNTESIPGNSRWTEKQTDVKFNLKTQVAV